MYLLLFKPYDHIRHIAVHYQCYTVLHFCVLLGLPAICGEKDNHHNYASCICAVCFIVLIVAPGCICGLIAALLSFEKMSFVLPAGLLWYLGTKRFPEDNLSSEF